VIVDENSTLKDPSPPRTAHTRGDLKRRGLAAAFAIYKVAKIGAVEDELRRFVDIILARDIPCCILRLVLASVNSFFMLMVHVCRSSFSCLIPITISTTDHTILFRDILKTSSSRFIPAIVIRLGGGEAPFWRYSLHVGH
jgi:hypothetical protein